MCAHSEAGAQPRATKAAVNVVKKKEKKRKTRCAGAPYMHIYNTYTAKGLVSKRTLRRLMHFCLRQHKLIPEENVALCPLIHISLSKLQSMQNKCDKLTLSHVDFFPLFALIDLDFINSSVKCCVNGLADQSHASLPFNSQILLTVWSGGLPFIPPHSPAKALRPVSVICPTHSSGILYSDSDLD